MCYESNQALKRILSNSLLDVNTDWKSVKPNEVQADLIDVPMLILQKEEHLMPKCAAKLFRIPFNMIRIANLTEQHSR